MNQSLETNRRIHSSGSILWIGLALTAALVVALADLLTKWWITRELGPGAERISIQIFGDFIELQYGQNSGVAFGLFSGSTGIAGILVAVVIVPLVIVLLLLATRGLPWAIAGGLVLGGAFGNLIDRVEDQHVTDFISVGSWPSFNLADAAISVGAVLLIVLSFRDERRKATSPR